MTSILSSLYESYGFSTTVSNGIEILYSYNVKDPLVSFIDIGYSFNDEYDDEDFGDIVYIPKSAATQQILNNLPPWMEMRKNYDSNGNQLVNAWGGNLESIIDLYSTLRKDSFLMTADMWYDVPLASSELTGKGQRVYEPVMRNLLYNSSFSIDAGARFQKPLGWKAARNTLNGIQFNYDNSLFGSRAILLAGTEGGGDLSQTASVIVPGGPVTASVFIKTPYDNGESADDVWDSSEAGLLMLVLNADDTVETYGVGFPKNTSGVWIRASLTANLTKETHKITFMLVNRTALDLIVDCPLLEQSETLNVWTSSTIDFNKIISTSSGRTIAGAQVLFESLDGEPVKKIELLPLSSESEFKNIKIPTRIEPFYPNGDSSNSFSLSYGRHIDFHDDIYPNNWLAVDGSIQQMSAITPDIFSIRLPADVIQLENGDLAVDLSLINNEDTYVYAVSAVDNMLYVVTQDTYLDKTAYYFKVVQPYVNSFDDNYMPALCSIELPLDIGSDFGVGSQTEQPFRIGISKNYPNVIFIDTTRDRRFYFKLYFDYFFADFNLRRVFCRENYSTENGHLQII